MKYRVFTYDTHRVEYEVEADSEEEAEAMFQWEAPEEVTGEVEVVDDYWDGVEIEFIEEVEPLE